MAIKKPPFADQNFEVDFNFPFLKLITFVTSTKSSTMASDKTQVERQEK